MGKPAEIRISSRLAAAPARAWERATSAEGINYELRPWMRMTVPRGVDDLDISSVEIGRPIGRSWVLLFGLIPFDYDEITLVRLDEGRGFLERSPMLSQRFWEHERTIEPAGDGCVLSDRVRFEPRFGRARWVRPLIGAVFRHRHRRLRKYFGGAPA